MEGWVRGLASLAAHALWFSVVGKSPAWNLYLLSEPEFPNTLQAGYKFYRCNSASLVSRWLAQVAVEAIAFEVQHPFFPGGRGLGVVNALSEMRRPDKQVLCLNDDGAQ